MTDAPGPPPASPTGRSGRDPSALKVVPVRHPWRWVASAVILVLLAMLVNTLVFSHVVRGRHPGGPVPVGRRRPLPVRHPRPAGDRGHPGADGHRHGGRRRSSAWSWPSCGSPPTGSCRGRRGSTSGSSGAPRSSSSSSSGTSASATCTSTSRWASPSSPLALFTLNSNHAGHLVRRRRPRPQPQRGRLHVRDRPGRHHLGRRGPDRGRAVARHVARLQTLRRIVLPQAMRVIIPPTGNETISMLKTTSLVSAIAVVDLFQATQNIANTHLPDRAPAARGQPLVPLLHVDHDHRAVLHRAVLRPGLDPPAATRPRSSGCAGHLAHTRVRRCPPSPRPPGWPPMTDAAPCVLRRRRSAAAPHGRGTPACTRPTGASRS